jgi:hypothetical protein
VTVVPEPAEPAEPAEPTDPADLAGSAPRCERCGTELPERAGSGRRRRFCSDACRQAVSRVRRPKRRCQLRVGATSCPRPAIGRVHGAALPGAVVEGAVDASLCEVCAPIMISWLTITVGVQPAWLPYSRRFVTR